MPQPLPLLLAAYEALPEKSGLYAHSLSTIIREQEAALRAEIATLIFDLSVLESWSSAQVTVELYDARRIAAQDLEMFREGLSKRCSGNP